MKTTAEAFDEMTSAMIYECVFRNKWVVLGDSLTSAAFMGHVISDVTDFVVACWLSCIHLQVIFKMIKRLKVLYDSV